MNTKKNVISFILFSIFILAGITYAAEVGKGKIPADQLKKTFKTLPWGVAIWDVDDAITALKSKGSMVWIDTRPESLFNKGSVAGAELEPYNRSGEKGNDLTKDSLAAILSKKGLSKDTAKIIFFCQGPKCHRSYNATYVAVSSWGYAPENIVWFRAGYPFLFKAVKKDPKLKRKAKRYLNSNGRKQL